MKGILSIDFSPNGYQLYDCFSFIYETAVALSGHCIRRHLS